MLSRIVTATALAGLVLVPGARLYAPPTPKPTVESMPSVEKYLLNDTTMVVVVNAKPILDSAVFTKNVKPELEKLLEHEAITRYFKAFGITPLKDLERMVFVYGEDKVRSDGPREERIQVLWQGKFDEKKLKAGFAEMEQGDPKTFKKIEKDGKTVYQVDRNMYFALLDSKTILMCPGEKIALEGLARASGKEKPKFASKDLTAALKTLSESKPVQAFALEKYAFSHEYKNENINGKFTFTSIPITLGQKGVRKFTIVGEAKDDVSVKVVIEGKDKKSFEEPQRQIVDGLDKAKMELDKEGQREPLAAWRPRCSRT